MNSQITTNERPSRHHPLTVTLHWLIALIVVTEAAIGAGILHLWPNTAVKIEPLTIHMILGLTMLFLMIVQIATRFVTPRPARATAGNAFLDFIAKATHALLYVFTILMGGTGLLLAMQSRVLQLVAGGKVVLPMFFRLDLHAAIFVLFGLLCSLHVVGALYHQFILKDRIFARMGYGARPAQRPLPRPVGKPVNNL